MDIEFNDQMEYIKYSLNTYHKKGHNMIISESSITIKLNDRFGHKKNSWRSLRTGSKDTLLIT